jgi:hypothetical protein
LRALSSWAGAISGTNGGKRQTWRGFERKRDCGKPRRTVSPRRNFQSWILEQANRAGVGVGDIHTAIDSALANPLKLRHLTAQLAGRFEEDRFVNLLQTIAGHDRLVVVERLEVQMTPVPRFEMVVGTYLRPAPRV